MTILAQFQNQNVEILDTYQAGGVTMASVKAIEGTPFVGGNDRPTRTAYTTCKADELAGVHSDQPQAEQTQQTNLLALALAQAKPQWHSGESIWIWRGARCGAFLKNMGDFIRLYLTDRDPGLVVFYLTLTGWQPAANLESNYQAWTLKVKAAR